MDQSVQFPKRRRIKVNPINEINKEVTIVTYKQFFIDHLQNIKNRTKAISDLELLCQKYEELQATNATISAFRVNSLAEDLVRQHFDSIVNEQFNKDIKVELKTYNSSSSNFSNIL